MSEGVLQFDLVAGWHSQHPDWVHDIDKKKDKKNRPDNIIGKKLLAARVDFRDEPSELAKILLDRGHVLVMSPKCHPELAVGLGMGLALVSIVYSYLRSRVYSCAFLGLPWAQASRPRC